MRRSETGCMEVMKRRCEILMGQAGRWMEGYVSVTKCIVFVLKTGSLIGRGSDLVSRTVQRQGRRQKLSPPPNYFINVHA